MPGPVAADDAEELSGLDREGDVVERVQDVHRAAAQRMQRTLLQRADLFPRNLEALVDPVHDDRGRVLGAHLLDEGYPCGTVPIARAGGDGGVPLASCTGCRGGR